MKAGSEGLPVSHPTGCDMSCRTTYACHSSLSGTSRPCRYAGPGPGPAQRRKGMRCRGGREWGGTYSGKDVGADLTRRGCGLDSTWVRT